MKYRLIILVLLIGAVLAGIWLCRNDDQPPAPTPTIATLPPRAAAIAQLPGRPVDYSRGAIVRVEVVFEDGTTQIVLPGVVVATATPIPTDTSHATATASATATSTPPIAATWTPTNTYTPPPTNTPRPTATEAIVPSATPTSTPFYTPTIEVNTPSPTLTPTLETFPACGGTVNNAAGLNMRKSPSIDGDLIIQLQHGGTVEVVKVIVYEQHKNEWAYVISKNTGLAGYVAAWYYGGVQLLVWDETDPNCLPPYVGYEYINDPLPELAHDGYHTLAGEGVGVVLAPQFVSQYDIIKCLDGGFSVCQQAQAANPKIETIYRTYTKDCPPEWWEGNAAAWWNYLKPRIPPGSTWIEVMNECDPVLERAGALAQAMIEIAQQIENDPDYQGTSLLAFSSGPGNPDFAWWREYWTYINWAVEHNAQYGTRHGVAFHTSVYAPNSVSLPSGSWVNEPFIAGRWAIVCALAEANDYGAPCSDVIAIASEAGATDGYQGSSGTFSCYQKGLMYKESIKRYGEDGLYGFAWWSVGAAGSWTDDSPCVADMLF